MIDFFVKLKRYFAVRPLVIAILWVQLLLFSSYSISEDSKEEGNQVNIVLKREYQYLVRDYINQDEVNARELGKKGLVTSIVPEKVALSAVSKWIYGLGGEHELDNAFEDKFRESINFVELSYPEAKKEVRRKINADKSEIRLVSRVDMGTDQETGRPSSALIDFEIIGPAVPKIKGGILLYFDAEWVMGVHDNSFIAQNWRYEGNRRIVSEKLDQLPR